MKRIPRPDGVLLLLIFLAAGCSRPAQSGDASPLSRTEADASIVANASVEPRTVVVWISIDGMRGDYVDSAHAPFCRRLMKEGAFTRKWVPVFPSLTFPSHVSQATGASVNRHGIIANAIYDDQRDVRWVYPNVAAEMLCEPIWNTVKRGGKRVLVHDWPVSQQQCGEFKADYFDQKFDVGLSDQQRLHRLIDTWKQDSVKQPLQLLMGYVSAVDKAGHKYGPHASQTQSAIEAMDSLLASFFQQCQQVFREKMSASDRFYFVLSTDHGMDEVRVILNPRLMCGSAWNDEMRIVASGNAAHIFLERLGPPPMRQPHIEKLQKRLKTYPFANTFSRNELPKAWEYDHPTRTGDVVVALDTGYFFSEKEGPEMSTIDPAHGPLGMHGYPASENPNMLGFMAIWRSGKPMGGVDLGELDSRRLHATVAHLLRIKPAVTAVQEPIELP